MNKHYATINELHTLLEELMDEGHGSKLITINDEYAIVVDDYTREIQYTLKEPLQGVIYIDFQTW